MNETTTMSQFEVINANVGADMDNTWPVQYFCHHLPNSRGDVFFFSLDQNLKYSISGYNKLVVYLQSSKNNQVSDVIQ
jgi:hypothetical protein